MPRAGALSGGSRYQWARDAAGLAASTLDGLTTSVIELCEHYGLPPWQLKPPHVDRYFAGPGKRALARQGYDVVMIADILGHSLETARRYTLATEADRQRRDCGRQT
ncbi:hypothetical protein [Nonomuraea sp. B19D2]|uniref:hypothetical protein n=1 Tax=Nonomuraea sp. B19D2 TaxID=3159561 RepID=UPI0032D9E940